MRSSFIIVWVCLVLAGCQSETLPPGDGIHPPLSLRILLPASLTRDPGLFARFRSRVSRMDLEIKTKAGVEWHTSFPPEQWDQLALPEIEFPKEDQDWLRIQIRVWDRTSEGMPRSYAVLHGTGRVRADELTMDSVNVILVRLSLKISVSEY